jgi:hypothetical protein
MIAAGFGDEDPKVIVCQGPPVCGLQGDEAEAAMRAGCVWCRRITIHADGTETMVEPAST